jgi:hypothetical protein
LDGSAVHANGGRGAEGPLRLDLVDDLRVAVAPVTLGGGLRLPEGIPSARWALAEVTALAHGAVGEHYRRP